MERSNARLGFIVVMALVFIPNGPVQTLTATPTTSGVYLTPADYKASRLSFEGDCKSEAHRLELHDVLNKPLYRCHL